MNLKEILKKSIEMNVSDVILTSNARLSFKIHGKVTFLWEDILSNTFIEELLTQVMLPQDLKKLEEDRELDFSISLDETTRFRVNAFYSRNGIGAIFRAINSNTPDFKALGLPNKIIDFLKKKSWLILVTGSVWSGKSTTLTAIIDTINANMNKHIITIEDPIEYIFKNKKSVIEQREVWRDTLSFDNGLKYALRQASDVIMIWEMRDLETFRLALRAAETGNLVIATLHTSWAARTVSRIIDMFPADERNQIQSQLADSLLWVIWQDLLEKKDKQGRVLACELLVNNTAVWNMIRKWLNHQIDSAMETGAEDWMITMAQCLDTLQKKDLI